jgi:hypothetical protein
VADADAWGVVGDAAALAAALDERGEAEGPLRHRVAAAAGLRDADLAPRVEGGGESAPPSARKQKKKAGATKKTPTAAAAATKKAPTAAAAAIEKAPTAAAAASKPPLKPKPQQRALTDVVADARATVQAARGGGAGGKGRGASKKSGAIKKGGAAAAAPPPPAKAKATAPKAAGRGRRAKAS